MATFRSDCPVCKGEIVRVYGEMGEGLLSEQRCGCGDRLVLGDWVAVGLVLFTFIFLAVR
jgi:hypothetical protein